ncbi:MAG TPA: hypothetical protein PLZ57_13280 [Pseudobdellovibrionaceae bacterium]|nr:hypothetical protein [Pseudobdellovibrionaceae bacterium]
MSTPRTDHAWSSVSAPIRRAFAHALTCMAVCTAVFGGGAMVGPSALASTSNSAPVASDIPPLNVLSFRAWKDHRVNDARIQLERAIADLNLERGPIVDRAPGQRAPIVKADAKPVAAIAAGATKTARVADHKRLESRVEQAKSNLEMAQELNVSDYFAVYLSQFRTREAMLEAARQMSPEDVADLMLAYQKAAAQDAAGAGVGGPMSVGQSLNSPRF